MRAFSLDLRQRVLDAALRGDRTEQAVADAFGVSLAFVQKIKRRWRTHADGAPTPMAHPRRWRTHGTAKPVEQRRGPRPRLSDDDRAALAEHVRRAPDATDEEHRAWLATERGVEVSRPTVNRALARLGLTRKKRRSRPPNVTART